MARTTRGEAFSLHPTYSAGRPAVAKALVGHFVAPDPIAAAQVQALRRRVADLEARVLLLETELAAAEAAAQARLETSLDPGEPVLV